jgi:hypothetical protein
MHATRQMWMIVPAICTAFSVRAENMQLDANLLLTGMDAGGSDDFKSGRAVTVHYDYFLKDWLAADVGLMVSDKTMDQSRKDIVGDYRASIQTESLLLGVKPRYKYSAPYEIYGRLALQYWRTELEVEEYFAPGIDGGVVSATDTGYGYYVGIGGAHYVTEKFIVQLELIHMKQLDVFDGKSDYPFDLTVNALSIGLGYYF